MKVIDAQKSKSDSPPSIGGVIVTHGHLASEFIAAAEMIIGPMLHVTPASIDWHDDIEVARAELERAIARVSRGRGVLLLTDMFGQVGSFSFPKALHLVEDCVRVSALQDDGTVLDFFAGSGTTGHATLNLNRAAGGTTADGMLA